MKFSCPQCGQHLAADDGMAGQAITCPACAVQITIPAAAASATVPISESLSQPEAPATAPIPAAPALDTVRSGSSRRRLVAALVSIIALGVIGVAGWWMWGNLSPASGRAGGGGKSFLAQWSGPEIVDLKVFPSAVDLSGKRDQQLMVVQATFADGTTRDVTERASFAMPTKGMVRFEKNILRPAADGRMEVTVKYDGRTAAVPVSVHESTLDRPVSFKLDVMPVFMKAGCNAGACHGSSRGKDGFRLSLFGYDPDGDYLRLTREQIGRRVNLALPEESLLLEKSLGTVPHTGGERFKKDSELYQTILGWLKAGAPKDATNVAKVVGLEMMPAQAVLEGSNSMQRLCVRAKYSDGTDRDVSTLAVFISNNEPSAKVSDQGLVTAGQRGEAFVMARFDSFTVGAQIIVIPKGLRYEFPQEIAAYNYVDEHVFTKLKKLRLVPSGLCDDATFVRRAYLDIIGILPSLEQTEKFLEESSAGKREALVDELIQRKEFADLWVMKWAELLQIRSRQDQFSQKSALQYYRWLQDQMLQNVPINRIVQQLITARGSTFRNPAANYYQVQTDTLKTAENCAQVFMGMRIQCAQCHNHPFDRWTMNDYYSFAAFFPQIGRKTGEDPRETIVFDKEDGDVKHPVSGKAMKPKFLGGGAPDIGEGESRREVLAKWIASPENPYFARNLANIVWAHFFGKGIIEPVDDVRISNPPSNVELLDALASKFTEYNYDFKKLVHDLCTSRTYQLATRANDSNASDDRNFARAGIRRLRAEVLLDCISQVTETRDKFQGLPRGAHAVEIADGNVSTYFLSTFGRASRETVCSCEVKMEPNLSQALHLLNGSTVQGKIEDGGVVKALLKKGVSPDGIIENLYLRCLARKPTETESAALLKFVKQAQEPAETERVLNDVFWSLLNAKEMIFNH